MRDLRDGRGTKALGKIYFLDGFTLSLCLETAEVLVFTIEWGVVCDLLMLNEVMVGWRDYFREEIGLDTCKPSLN